MENQKSVFCLAFYLILCGVFYAALSTGNFQTFFLSYLENQYQLNLSSETPQILLALKEFKKYTLLLFAAGVLFFVFKRIKNFEKQNLILWLLALFILSFCLRFIFCNYPRIFSIYRDELLYFQLAQNLAEGRGFLVHNLPTNFQKILYNVFLMPYFWTKSQMVLVSIQAFLVASSIFPIFLIAKKILNKNKTIIGVLIFSIFLPDFNYSQTFMSETLFLPLSLWLFYFFLIVSENKKLSTKTALAAFAFGVLCYFGYLCKEIAILLLPSFFIFQFFKKSKNAFLSFVFFALGFLLLFLLFKFTIFKGFGDFYNQSDSYVLFLDGRPIYLIYSFFYFLVQIILGAGFFGALLPFVCFKNLNDNSQKLFVFLWLMIIFTAAAVAYFVFVREDFDFFSMYNPRALLRYVLYAWILFFIIMASLFEQSELKLPPKIKTLFFIIPLAFILTLYQGVADFSYIEQNVLNYLLPVFESESTKNQVLIFKIVLFVLNIFAIYFIFFKNKIRQVLKIFLIVFCALQVFNNAWAMLMLPFKYGVRQEEIAQTQKIADFILQNFDKNFLILGEAPTRPLALTDNFLNYKNVATVGIHTLLDLQQFAKNAVVSDIPIAVLSRSFTQNWTQFPPQSYALKSIDFVLLPNIFAVRLPAEWAIPNVGGEIFTLYKNPNPQILPPVAVLPAS